MILAGRATHDATRRFHDRHRAGVAADHVRTLGGLSLSSVGLGTYLGTADDAGDRRYQAAIARAFELGINVVDAAINYRHQRSERAVGEALRAAAAAGIPREEIVLSTKGGFIAFDGAHPRDRAYLEATYVTPGLFAWSDVVAGCHCLAPRFLDDQIDRSRRNLGVETLDIYYLHNPETQLEELPWEDFVDRMRDAFTVLERAVSDGRIACYGTATWDGYRRPPGTLGHLDLFALVDVARELAGDRHHFRVLQLPVNRRAAEAVSEPTQERAGHRLSLLDAASELGLYVMSSASLQQGKLAPDPDTARAALEWVRTRRGLGTALVGMGRPEHVDINAGAFRRSDLA